MRVLLFNTDLEVGGTPAVVRELARRLPSVGVGTSVACLGRFGPVAGQIEDDGGRVTAFGRRAWQGPLAVRDLRRLARRERADVVMSFLVHANVVAALSGLPQRAVRADDPAEPALALAGAAAGGAAGRAGNLLLAQRRRRGAGTRRGGGREDRGHPQRGSERVADEPKPARRAMRVGFLGRLDPVKRVGLLIEACRAAGVPLEVYGDGPERAAARSGGGRWMGG